MAFPLSPSPPPPLPSPALVPIPLPSPPPLTKIPSRRHVSIQAHPSPPVRDKTLVHALSLDALHRAPRTPPVHAENTRRSSPHRTIKRAISHLPSRCRSPPPSPAIRSPPPPVPPIPAFVLTTNHAFIRPSVLNRAPPLDLYLDHPSEVLANMRCESHPGGPLSCMQFLAVHKPKGQSET